MLGWNEDKRIRALEAELAELRAQLARSAADRALETERTRAASLVAQLGGQLAEIHELTRRQQARSSTLEVAVSGLGTRLEDVERRTGAAESAIKDVRGASSHERAEGIDRRHSEIGQVQSAVRALEQQLAFHIEQVNKITDALLRPAHRPEASERLQED